jgi:hypothetical protein
MAYFEPDWKPTKKMVKTEKEKKARGVLWDLCFGKMTVTFIGRFPQY